MDDYANSIEKVEGIRKSKGEEELTEIEKKIYCKFVG
jgi:hypothetical protein